MKKQGITVVYKGEVETGELDFKTIDEILGKDWSDNSYPTTIEKGVKSSWRGDSLPVSIDYVIKTLEKFKKKGANYVEIVYHSDHMSYIFNGAEVHKSTDAELNEYDIKIKAEQQNSVKANIKKLTIELKNLEKKHEKTHKLSKH